MIYDVVVIGAGPAGMAAAIAAHDEGARVLILDRNNEPGGILPQCIHAGFGARRFKQDLPGPLYAYHFLNEIRKREIELWLESFVMDISPSRRVTVLSPKGYYEIEARSIVLAMGCRERTRSQINIPGTHPAGVYTAGTVQRMINRENWMPGKRFIILGSGDIGMIMARRITIEGGEVLRVVEALPYLTGLRRNYVQCLQDFGIPLFLRHTITRIDGYERVERVEITPLDENFCPIKDKSEWVDCDTLLLSVGLIPENELSRRLGIVLDPVTGGPVVDQFSQTSVYGIFAAGNVVHIYDLVDDVSDHGELAGRFAARFAKNLALWSEPSLSIGWNFPLRSVVPQKILLSKTTEEPLSFFLRVHTPWESSVTLSLRGEDSLFFQKKLPYVRPAEMISVSLDPSLVQTWKNHPPSRLFWEITYDS
ncbi:MAG: NAD(P)/FAD-dependent oxidoreductase [Brevinematales bacterium]|nr:NAD(P)/FAD-dependent oxidoreductase [Brevinematales bacterium]